MKTILILRRDEAGLSEGELNALRAKWPGEELKFVRTDPRDFKDHAGDCRRIKPDVVILPVERPIPSVAMQEGFQHITLGPSGDKFLELKKIDVHFEPF